MKFTVCFFILTGVALADPVPVAGSSVERTVRMVTIRVPEVQAVRAALLSAPDEEDQLARELAVFMAAPLTDMLLRCGTGPVEISASSEIPYVTEYKLQPEWRQVTPNSVAFRNTGIQAAAEISRGIDGAPESLDYSWTDTRYAGRKSFPCVSVKTDTPVVQPIFLTDRISGRIAVKPGHWRLAGMTRPISAGSETSDPGSTFMTFIKVSGGKAVPQPAPDTRLHLLAFSLPAREGMELMLRPGGGDAVLVDQLMERVGRGEAGLLHHGAALFCRNGPSAPVAPAAESDPFAAPTVAGRAGGAVAESIHEDVYPTSWPDPVAFNYRNAGTSLTIQAAESGAGPTGVSVSWESVASPALQLPLTPFPEGSLMTAPEYRTESLTMVADLAAGEVCLAGAMFHPDEHGMDTMTVYFLKRAGRAPAVASTAPAVPSFHAGLISLPPADGKRLTALDPEQQWSELVALLERGAARMVAWQGIAGAPGARVAAKHFSEVPSTAGSSVLRNSSGILFTENYSFHTLGSSFEIRIPAEGEAGTGRFTVSLDRPAMASAAQYEQAARQGTKLPEWARKKFTFPPAGENLPPLLPGVPLVVSLSPSPVTGPDGESGAWLAAVLIRRR